MLAFACTEWVTRANSGGQTRKTRSTVAAIFAIVFRFLVTLIQSVFAFTRTIWVASASCSRQAGDAGGFVAAILTVAVHSCMLVGGLQIKLGLKAT